MTELPVAPSVYKRNFFTFVLVQQHLEYFLTRILRCMGKVDSCPKRKKHLSKDKAQIKLNDK